MRARPALLPFAIVAAAVAFQIVCPIVLLSQGSQLAQGPYAAYSDAARYRTIIETPGRPYRDFEVEYPPLAVGLFRSLGPDHFGGFRQRLLLVQIACQALIVFLLCRVWGRRAMWSYLVLSAPMLFIIYPGFDLVALAPAVGGAALMRSRLPVGGGAAFVGGAFVKVWPVVLLPALVVRRQFRAVGAAVALGAAGLAVWAVRSGTGAVGQVLTYRGARGWEYESVAGALLRIATGARLRLESGAVRVGSPPRLVTHLFSFVAIASVGAIWMLAARRPRLTEGLAEAAVITALLVFGTLLSPQFLIWPLPFVAIAGAGGARSVERWAGALAVLTLVGWIVYDSYRPGLGRSEVAIILRNGALVGLMVAMVLEMRRAPRFTAGASTP